jgi:GntP family gluconate:H+ symporter
MGISPWLILAVGLATVLGLMVLGRVHAFVALVVSAMVVSLLAPGVTGEKMARVAEAFGTTAAKIGIVIAMAALVGKAMLESGAADRIVRSALRLFGPQRAAAALCASGFILAIPVFFDTVFYLLVPLAYSLWRQTRRNYLLYLTAIAAGGVITHTLVPPTPGPLYMAACLKIDLGLMIVVGVILGLPVAVVALQVCHLMNRWMPIPMRILSEHAFAGQEGCGRLPPLWLALLPVVLPVILISTQTVANLWAEAQKAPTSTQWVSPAPPADQPGAVRPNADRSSDAAQGRPTSVQQASNTAAVQIAQLAKLIGDANFALFLSAVIALGTLMGYRGWTLRQVAAACEEALSSAGIIILITSAGGAFGAMLGQSGLKEAVQHLFPQGSLPPAGALAVAFLTASLLKIAQGSSTVAIMTTANMFAAMGAGADTLGFHPVYLAATIASGSLVGSWMNDSGFWIFTKMGGLTEAESLRSWTVLLALIGTCGFLVSLLASWLVPLV